MATTPSLATPTRWPSPKRKLRPRGGAVATVNADACRLARVSVCLRVRRTFNLTTSPGSKAVALRPLVMSGACQHGLAFANVSLPLVAALNLTPWYRHTGPARHPTLGIQPVELRCSPVAFFFVLPSTVRHADQYVAVAAPPPLFRMPPPGAASPSTNLLLLLVSYASTRARSYLQVQVRER